MGYSRELHDEFKCYKHLLDRWDTSMNIHFKVRFLPSILGPPSAKDWSANKRIQGFLIILRLFLILRIVTFYLNGLTAHSPYIMC